jgi:branched-chain amino acid transport system substrate-binding protein
MKGGPGLKQSSKIRQAHLKLHDKKGQRFMKKLVSFVLAALMILAVGCSAPAQNAPEQTNEQPSATNSTPSDTPAETVEPIKIAVCGPMTGDNAEFCIGYKIAVGIMADEWNANGGLLGRPIEIVPFDDKGMPEEAANVAQQVASRDDIVAVIGHFNSTCSMAAAPIYQEKRLVEISPSSSHYDYTAIGDCMFRICPLSRDEMKSMSISVLDNFKAEKVGLLVINSDWGLESAKLCHQYIEELSKEKNMTTQIVAEEVVVDGNDDYSAVCTKFKDAGVDTIMLVTTYAVSVPFINQVKKVLPDVNIQGAGSTFTAQTLEICGENAEGLICTAAFAYVYDDPVIKTFTEKFIALHPQGKFPLSDAGQSYAAAGTLFTAIQNAGSTDTDSILEQLKVIEYPSVIGLVKFDERRDCPREYRFVTVENGEWKQYNG